MHFVLKLLDVTQLIVMEGWQYFWSALYVMSLVRDLRTQSIFWSNAAHLITLLLRNTHTHRWNAITVTVPEVYTLCWHTHTPHVNTLTQSLHDTNVQKRVSFRLPSGTTENCPITWRSSSTPDGHPRSWVSVWEGVGHTLSLTNQLRYHQLITIIWELRLEEQGREHEENTNKLFFYFIGKGEEFEGRHGYVKD